MLLASPIKPVDILCSVIANLTAICCPKSIVFCKIVKGISKFVTDLECIVQ